MTIDEILKQLEAVDASVANQARGFLGNLKQRADQVDDLEGRVGGLQSDVERLTGQKAAAVDESVKERKTRQALEQTVTALQKAGIVNKDGQPAFDAEQLGDVKKALGEVTELRARLAEIEGEKRQTALHDAIQAVHQEKGYTSGLKVLTDAAGGRDLDPGDAESLTQFVAEIAGNYGKEIFKVPPADPSGDPKGAGDGDPPPGAGDDPGAARRGGGHATPDPPHSVTNYPDGAPSKIAVSSTHAGVRVDEAPTMAELAKEQRAASGVEVPRAVAARVGTAAEERAQRGAARVGTGADDKPIADLTSAIK